jgi:predicted PurR-regulated permease PerM
MVLKGSFIAVGLAFVGAPFWPVFGAAAGLLTIVPVVGPAAAAIPSLYLCFAQGGPKEALFAGVVFLAAEAVEGYVLIPKLIGKEVGLHPVAVITAILIGGALLGGFGVVIAIPLAASARIVWTEFVLPALRAKAAEAPTKE